MPETTDSGVSIEDLIAAGRSRGGGLDRVNRDAATAAVYTRTRETEQEAAQQQAPADQTAQQQAEAQAQIAAESVMGRSAGDSPGDGEKGSAA